MAKPWFNQTSITNFLCLPEDTPRPLSRFDVFRLKNWMLIGNYLANIVAFVLMEKFIFRGHLARFFFSEGGLHKTPKTIRNRMVVRLLALLFACSTIPFLSFNPLGQDRP